jgi:hypothetical protein
MDAPPDDLFGLGEKSRLAGHPMTVEQCEDRVPGPPTRTVVVGRARLARQTGIRSAQPPQHRPPSIVHLHHPPGEIEHRLAGHRVAREQPVQPQAGRIIVLVGRPAAADARMARIRTMTAAARGDVMRRVPEEPSVIGRLVPIRVIDVDVHDMGGEVVHHPAPSTVARAHELVSESRDRIVLVVVMRHDWRRRAAVRVLVVRVQVAEVPPPVLVHEFAFPGE